MYHFRRSGQVPEEYSQRAGYVQPVKTILNSNTLNERL